MKRRLGAVLIGLALTLPVIAVVPVSAHVGGGWAIEWGSILNGEGQTVSGFVTNHLSSRRANIEVTGTWRNGATVMDTVTVPAMIDNLAAHASSPFRIFNPAPVEAGWSLTVSVSASTLSVAAPVGALSVQPGSFVDKSAVYEGEITNVGSVVAHDVVVYGWRRDGVVTDAAGSDTIATLDPGETVTYSIAFDAERSGEVEYLIAQTTSGDFLTSWNNYFGDLGNSSEIAADAIAWMADQGITTGCGNASFCPKDPVTRAQMAVFLARALELTDGSFAGFTDIGGLSRTFRESINALKHHGIAEGCATDPLRFCPNGTVTRGQMSKFIVTGYGQQGNKAIAPIAGAGPFLDDAGHFSEPYNNAMADGGITSGCAADRYCPFTNVTREQMAIFMMRANELPDGAP